MDNGCPRCEYTIRWGHFKRECEEAFAKKSPGPQADENWPFPLIIRYLNEVSDFDSSRGGKGHDPNWSVLTVRLVGIYRDELSKFRAERDWDQQQESKAERERWRHHHGGARYDRNDD